MISIRIRKTASVVSFFFYSYICIYIIYILFYFIFWGVGGGWIVSTKACGLDDMFPPDSLWFDLDAEHELCYM